MKRLTHIRPGSAFKVGFAMYALLFGILGLLALLLTLLGMGALRDVLDIAGVGAGIAGALIGYVISVALYGLAGGVFSVIAAAIYNVVAGWTGGLEIEVS